MKASIIGLLIFAVIAVIGSICLAVLGILVNGPEWLDEPLDNFDFALLLAIMIGFMAAHRYEDHRGRRGQ